VTFWAWILLDILTWLVEPKMCQLFILFHFSLGDSTREVAKRKLGAQFVGLSPQLLLIHAPIG